MEYKVIVTSDAEENFDAYIRYLIFEKGNKQAASNLINDFEATKESLSLVAGSLKYCNSPKLKQLGYKKMRFLSHRYFILFRIVEDTAIIDKIFHELQDYENKIG